MKQVQVAERASDILFKGWGLSEEEEKWLRHWRKRFVGRNKVQGIKIRISGGIRNDESSKGM